MDEQHEAVEGRAIAREILDALGRSERADWTAFHDAYHRRLLRVAEREYRSRPSLRQEHDSPEDLVQLFLAYRVYPPDRARSMLGPSAGGQRPLWPRLATSLGNFCVDLARAARSHARERPDQAAVEAAQARASVEPADREDLRHALQEQMDAIRRHVVAGKDRRAPYRAALFLRLRLDWLGGFAGAMVRQSGSGETVAFDSGLLEELIPWSEEEKSVPLGESGLTLSQAWDRLCPLLEATPDQPLPAAVIASTLSISRDSWDAWVSRGWKQLQRSLGEERFAQVFPFWRSRQKGEHR